jgi:hypothetical protein
MLPKILLLIIDVVIKPMIWMLLFWIESSNIIYIVKLQSIFECGYCENNIGDLLCMVQKKIIHNNYHRNLEEYKIIDTFIYI